MISSPLPATPRARTQVRLLASSPIRWSVERPCAMTAGGSGSCDVVLCLWTCCLKPSFASDEGYFSFSMVFANWEL